MGVSAGKRLKKEKSKDDRLLKENRVTG